MRLAPPPRQAISLLAALRDIVRRQTAAVASRPPMPMLAVVDLDCLAGWGLNLVGVEGSTQIDVARLLCLCCDVDCQLVDIAGPREPIRT